MSPRSRGQFGHGKEIMPHWLHDSVSPPLPPPTRLSLSHSLSLYVSGLEKLFMFSICPALETYHSRENSLLSPVSLYTALHYVESCVICSCPNCMTMVVFALYLLPQIYRCVARWPTVTRRAELALCVQRQH